MAAGCAFAIGQDVVVGGCLMPIVVKHHHLIGEEFLFRGAHGSAAAARQASDDTSREYQSA